MAFKSLNSQAYKPQHARCALDRDHELVPCMRFGNEVVAVVLAESRSALVLTTGVSAHFSRRNPLAIGDLRIPWGFFSGATKRLSQATRAIGCLTPEPVREQFG
jgi:hypothetical protein